MIMPIAIAKEGFINLPYPLENSLEQILDILPFENKDLQFFDGNTCRLINDYDPTNSIFIYENQQGKFLYTITSASPVIHKNNMIWLCNCLMMENLNNYENLRKNYEPLLFNEIVYTKGVYNSIFINDPVKIQIKPNFQALEKFKIPFYSGSELYDYFTLKIKCTTNPTTENLTSKAPDGSFNFLFPIRILEADDGKINKFTTQLKNISETKTVDLYNLISTYLPNIKSIELLPFPIYELGGEQIGYDIIPGENFVRVEVGTFTDCGIFVESNYSTEYFGLSGIDLSKFPSFDAKELVVGGGIKGFLQTPLGNVDLQFNSDLFDDLATARFLVKEDGWKVDGKFKCEVPPHYLNFYTDNAGQLFIQNLTTNAQELRQINRDKIFKEESENINFVNSSLKSATGIISNLATGNFAGALGGVGNILNAGVETEFNKMQIEREYNKSLAEYRDKTKTQSLLASMTGRELTGQFSLIDFLTYVNNKYFCFYFETNYFKSYDGQFFICQNNYDYSIDVENVGYLPNYNNENVKNNINFVLQFKKVVIVENNNAQKEIRQSKEITLFLRNNISRTT